MYVDISSAACLLLTELKLESESWEFASRRSHFLISKGGVVKDARIGISSGDSVPEALKVVTGKESAPAAPKKSFGDV